MEYTIENKQGMHGELLLSVLVPETSVDEKALYTLAADQPDFLIPFRYRYVDGSVEFIYSLQNRLNLLFFSGSCSRADYISLWKSLIMPLEVCEDWFMSVDGFVFDMQYLYLEKQRNKVCYLYLPVKQDYSRNDAIRQLLQQVATRFTTDDSDLTVQVLKFILQTQSFQPTEFLKMLSRLDNEQYPVQEQKTVKLLMQRTEADVSGEPAQEEPVRYEANEQAPQHAQPLPEKRATPMQLDDFGNMDWDEDGQRERRGKKKKERTIKEKPQKEKKSLRFAFGRKEKTREPDKQIVRGGAQLSEPAKAPEQQNPVYVQEAGELSRTEQDGDGVTQLYAQITQLRYVGSQNHEALIPISIQDGEIFRIGRYDVTVGKRQSDFEFPPQTPAISRQHAAIMRKNGDYYIVDLDSRAGTYVNHTKIRANVQTALYSGDNVSFGNAGANYVFEL